MKGRHFKQVNIRLSKYYLLNKKILVAVFADLILPELEKESRNKVIHGSKTTTILSYFYNRKLYICQRKVDKHLLRVDKFLVLVAHR